MTKPFDNEPLRDYLARLGPTISHITLTVEMIRKLTGHPLRTNDWAAGEEIGGWEVVEVIPKVGLALQRTSKPEG